MGILRRDIANEKLILLAFSNFVKWIFCVVSESDEVYSDFALLLIKGFAP